MLEAKKTDIAIGRWMIARKCSSKIVVCKQIANDMNFRKYAGVFALERIWDFFITNVHNITKIVH